MPALSNYLLKELSQLYCIDHRIPANVFINEEGFITYTTCCDVLHQSLSDAQDILRSQFQSLPREEQSKYMPVA
ncbi:hypothetical protein F0919_01365 [Taibaiella lutea]|uniref:Uncharacterized protein n=1 Tax=Taibaiella lutea TaxID=2608001 RepID=A0A5M6CMI9_9BACT|nr:hypothetical protein [Taibaiella lutea]KAA5536344.1 hypothetical protein F0919_01365 [Taibaiella lutea]